MVSSNFYSLLIWSCGWMFKLTIGWLQLYRGPPGRGAHAPYPLVERGWRWGDDVTLAPVHVVTWAHIGVARAKLVLHGQSPVHIVQRRWTFVWWAKKIRSRVTEYNTHISSPLGCLEHRYNYELGCVRHILWCPLLDLVNLALSRCAWPKEEFLPFLC